MRRSSHISVAFIVALIGCGTPAPSSPASPTDVTAVARSSTTVDLQWKSTQPRFRIYRDGLPVGEAATTTFSDSGLTANTSYEYSVAAITGSQESPKSATATVVTPPSKPTLQPVTVSADEDTPFQLTFQPGEQTDPGPETRTIHIDLPDGFMLAAGPSDTQNQRTATPPANKHGSFQGTATMTTEGRTGLITTSDPVTIEIALKAVADQPTLIVSDATGAEDTPIALNVFAALADTDGSEAMIVLIDNVPTGTSLNAGTSIGTNRWTVRTTDLPTLAVMTAPNSAESFTLDVSATSTELSNGDTRSATAALTVTIVPVNDPPVAVGDSVTAVEDTPVSIQAAQLLENDSDIDGPSLMVTAASSATHGTVALMNGAVTFTPEADYSGTAGFDYTVSDGESFATAHVTIQISEVNDAPVAVDDSFETPEDEPLELTESALTYNDLDPDGPMPRLVEVLRPTHGSVVENGGAVTFTPEANYSGPAGFDYVISDGLLTGTGHASIVVLPQNDLPIARADALTSDEDVPLQIEVASLLINDSDVESEISFVDASNPSHGTLSLADGALTFVPDANFSGEAGFDYSVTDGDISSTGHVTIAVTAVNDPPIAGDDTATVLRNVALSVLTYTLLANDTDVDSPSLKISSVGNAVNGTVLLSGSQIKFTPATNFVGTASFEYVLTDGSLTDVGAVVVTVATCLPGTDTDGDRLDDCAETNTGTFVSASDTGTDPARSDTDNDGLSDGDEILGTVDGLDLPAMGANPGHKDIFLEYDWFDDNAEPAGCGPHSHRPIASELDHLAAAFSYAPISNPDGVSGISLHQDYGQGGAFTGGGLVFDSDGVLRDGVSAREFNQIKGANFGANRRGYFHYVLLPHAYNTDSTSSGQADYLGSDIIISLGCDPNYKMAYATMHELGHNIGLRHGGDTDCNRKPNYNSVMNYLFTFPGIDTDCDGAGDDILDYSRGLNVSLNEASLNEAAGICGGIGIDWNHDTAFTSNLSYNINGTGNPTEPADCGGIITTLRDYADWAHITLLPVTATNGPARLATTSSSPTVIDCPLPRPLR